MQQTVVITGANRGIGLALAEHYAAQGAQVYGLCRTSSAELAACGAKVLEGLDVGAADVVSRLRAALEGVQIDLLINNAGILRSERLGSIDFDTVAEQFAVNAMGPLRVTEALLGQLVPGAKVAMITSRMGSITDNTSGGSYGYRMSKAALNAAGMSLARDLKSHKIAVALLHPGYVQTEMVNHGGDISAKEAAERLAARISELTLDNSGNFWHSNGEQLPW